MQPAQWKRIKTIVNDALELPSGERSAFVEAACAGDSGLQAEVASLLAQSDETGRLELPIAASAEPDSGSVWIGRQLGAYRITEEILSGGMGRVFKAQRTDGEYDSTAAIKILRASIDTAEGRGRFNAERQILARLRHPRIATLIDGGTIDGLPYFVMEYVDGLPIDRYCGERKCDLRQRLGIFARVCGAVEFAHQQLIVHRDLKPENILATGDGEVKLLDFGIAKLLDAENWGGMSNLTMLGGSGPYTPAYAAPEQLLGQPVGTGSDVYSLGCILYRLLTGRLPFDLEAARGPAWIRAVCEQSAERPSVALQRAPNDGDTALRAGLPPPPALARLLRGDLDLIVLKALEKDLALRYGSVAELHADVRNYLEGRPVSARRPSFSYLALKFVRRNRLPVGAAALATLALAAGVAGIAWQARVAESMRLRAENRLLDVQALSQKLIFDYNDKIKVLPGALPVSQVLMADVAHFLDQLGKEDGLPLPLQRSLALSYQRLATAQGSFREGSLGKNDEAAVSRSKAYAIMNRLLVQVEKNPGLLPATGDDPKKLSRWQLILHVADIERDLMSDCMRLSKFDEARAHMERAAALAAQAATLAPALLAQATIMSEQAQFYAHHDGNYAEAIKLVRRTQDTVRALLKDDADDFDARYLLANQLTAEGLYLMDGMNDRKQALHSFLKGIEQDRIAHAAQPHNTKISEVLAGDLFRAGNLELGNKNLDSAKALLKEAQATIAPLLVSDTQNPYLAFVGGMISKALVDYYLQVNDKHGADIELRQMKEVSAKLTAADPRSYDHIYFSALVHFSGAKLALMDRKIPAANAGLEHGTALLLPIAKADNGMYRRLTGVQFAHADMLLDGGYWDDADQLLKRMAALAGALGKNKDADSYRAFATRLDSALERAAKGQAKRSPH